MDCLLLADGVLFVIEFKRTQLQRADRDQVMNYAVNLLEFHRATQEWCNGNGGIVVPVLVLTDGHIVSAVAWTKLAGHSWPAMAYKPLECDRYNLQDALRIGSEESPIEYDSVADRMDRFPISTFLLYFGCNVFALREP